MAKQNKFEISDNNKLTKESNRVKIKGSPKLSSEEYHKEEIQHSVTTFKGSSGSPIILLLRDYKIIGIHRGFDNTLNFGTSMKYIIEDIKKKILPLMENIGKWELR